MINNSFQGIESQFYEEFPKTQESPIWNIFFNLLESISNVALEIFNFIIDNASRLFEISCKLVGLAITGVSVTFAKIKELTTYISQINVNMINLAPQTTIHHHVHHYHVYSDIDQEERHSQLGVAY